MSESTERDDAFESAAALLDAGRLEEAEAACHALCDAHPTFAPAVSLMGIILFQTGRADVGVQFIERAVHLDPAEAAFANNLGTALTGLGRHADAVDAFTRAIATNPNYAQAHNNMGAALRSLGRLEDAARHYARAVEIAPDYGEAYANYANVLVDLNRISEAESAAQKAVEIRPDYAVAHNNLGTVNQRLGRYSDAEANFRRALEIAPEYPDALSNLGETLKDTGRAAAAQAPYHRSVELAPHEPAMGSNRLLALCNAAPPAEVAREHKAWGAKLGDLAHPDFQQHDREPNRCLKVGYVSPDFRRHSVAYFIEPLFEHHDRAQVEIHAFANMPGGDNGGDDVTQRLRGHADHWHDIFGTDDDSAAEIIRAEDVDILVDLSGHTRGNRLGLFARKPAPVQMTYLGYPATSGLTQMDWRLTDGWADPVELTERLHTERLLRIEGGFLCYRPDTDAPTVEASPWDANGHVTFGSFNNLAKVTPGVIRTWAEILKVVPEARMVIKAKALGDGPTADRLRATFSDHGIGADRLTLLAWITSGSPLAAYHDVDIALDTFPYNGTTTTCEALWMGVPTIGLAGNWHAARVGISLMTKLDMTDWIAATPPDYIALAAEKASDVAGLRAIRQDLRDRMKAHGLLDGARFARNLEAAYRTAWKDWIAETP